MAKSGEDTEKPVNAGRGKAKKSAREAREQRLSEALRANLAKRKAQSRDRDDESGD